MATLREIKQKRVTIQSINKITKAMELVATSKSKKSLNQLLVYRIYYSEMIKTLSKIVNYVEQRDDQEKTFWVVVGSDLGLAGGYNSNINKLALKNIKNNDKVLLIGNKVKNLKDKLETSDIEFYENEIVLQNNLSEEIANELLKFYFDNNYKVKIIYTNYISQIEFEPTIKTILPVPKFEEEKSSSDIEFEPSREELFNEILNTYVETTLIGYFREAKVSEYTSRRIAMENASNNGDDMLKELTIAYNRIRQGKITQEISEIIGGAEALK